MATNDSVSVKRESFKQKMLRKLYPTILKWGKKGKNGTVLINEQEIAPITSFYHLKVELNNGKILDLSELKGKKVLLVNTASNCGYTAQYAELQSLHEQYGEKLQIIAFPANDFAGQEKSNDADIEQFCQVNYGVTFPVAIKSTVVKKTNQHPIYKWLTDKNENGWNTHEPDWNFSKYLLNEKGVLTDYFGPSISPLEDKVIKALS